jgi:hypothetical protein
MNRLPLLHELLIVGALCLLASSCTWGDGTITDIRWQEPRGGPFMNGHVVDGSVHIESGPSGGTFNLIRFGFSSSVDPATYSDGMAVVGNVRYQDVQGQAYLEMTTYLAGHKVSVSRTLDDAGEGAVLTGSSDWRRFRLAYTSPSLNSFAPPTPTTVNIALVLPGRGSVDVGSLRVGTLTMGPREWWSSGIAVRGGAVGSVILIVLAALSTWLIARTRARRFVVSVVVVVVVCGLLLTGLALVASTDHQPPQVVLPPGVLGALLAVTGVFALRAIRHRYAEAELRRMRAMDAAAPVASVEALSGDPTR